MSNSDTKNVKLGVCSVIFDGVDLGYTKGGVEVEVTTETKKVEVDQFGKTPINEYIMGRMVSAKIPLAETTLMNMVRTMPGASLVQSGGAKASATVTFASAAAANNDNVTINGVVFTFKTVPAGDYEVLPGASFGNSAANLAAAVNNAIDPRLNVIATVVGGVVTLTALDFGTVGNAYTLAKTGTNITVSGGTFTGGTNWTKAKVVVNTGVGVDLLSIAKKLVLHPKANAVGDRSDDFTIPLAQTGGGISFAYKFEDERIFNVTFNGYPDPVTGTLYVVGDYSAT